jgi:hypothetical protein
VYRDLRTTEGGKASKACPVVSRYLAGDAARSATIAPGCTRIDDRPKGAQQAGGKVRSLPVAALGAAAGQTIASRGEGNPPGTLAGPVRRQTGGRWARRAYCGLLNSAAAGHGFIARAGRRFPVAFLPS